MKGHHFLRHHADLGDMARAVCIFADEMISVPLKQGVWRFDKEKKGLPKTAKDLVLRFNTEYVCVHHPTKASNWKTNEKSIT